MNSAAYGDIFGFEPEAQEEGTSVNAFQTVVENANSNLSDKRFLAVSSLAEAASIVEDDKDDCLKVFQTFPQFADDPDSSVRHVLMMQLTAITDRLRPKPSFKDYLSEFILPTFLKSSTDPDAEVRKSAHANLLNFTKHQSLSKDELGHLLVHTTESVTLIEAEEMRIEIIALMADLSEVIGRIDTSSFLLPTFLNLCLDSAFSIRKACAVNFGRFCSNIDEDTFEKDLLPKYTVLCQDSVWGVRKACAESFVDVAALCPSSVRQELFVRLLLGLLNDVSRWVRVSAYQTLGPFIATFASTDFNFTAKGEKSDDLNTEKLLENSNVMSQNSIEGQTNDGIAESEDDGKERTNPIVALNVTDEEAVGLTAADSVSSLGARTDGAAESDKPSGATGVERQEAVSEIQNEMPPVEVGDTDGGVSIDTGNTPGDIDLKVDVPAVAGAETVAVDNDQTSDDLFCMTTEVAMAAAEAVTNLNEVTEDELGDKRIVCQNTNDLSPAKGEKLAENESKIETNGVPAVDFEPPTEPSGDIGKNDTVAVGEIALDDVAAVVFEGLDLINDVGSSENSVLPVCTAHVSELSEPEQETVKNIGSMHVHVKDQLNIVDGVVQPADDLVKINITHQDVFTLQQESLDSNETKDDEKICRASVVHIPNESPSQNTGRPFIMKQCHGSSRFGLPLIAQRMAFYDDDSDGEGDLNPEKSSLEMANKELAGLQDIVPCELLEQYLNMAEPSRSHSVGSDILKHCAFSFPAVAYTLGHKNWPCLQHLYRFLARNVQWQVRRTLALSIHRLAVILGDDLVISDLLPVFDELIKDLDEVRSGVVKNLSKFLQLLPERIRICYLPKLESFLITETNTRWRYRQDFAQQLISLVSLFSVKDVQEHILPIAFVLAADKVAEVRHSVMHLLSAIVRMLSEKEKSCLVEMLEAVKSRLYENSVWRQRQLYISFCQSVLDDESLTSSDFLDLLLPSLLMLSNDPVPNVKIALGRFLSHVITTQSDLLSEQDGLYEPKLQETLEVLKKDKDHDVRYFVDPMMSCLLSIV